MWVKDDEYKFGTEVPKKKFPWWWFLLFIPLLFLEEENCVCPKCGYKTPQQISKPCSLLKCLKCGTNMIKEKKKI